MFVLHTHASLKLPQLGATCLALPFPADQGCMQITVTAKYKTQHNNLLMVLSQGRVSLEQRLGTALQTAILLIISLSFSAVSQIRLT
jgi:hypothetical protein